MPTARYPDRDGAPRYPTHERSPLMHERPRHGDSATYADDIAYETARLLSVIAQQTERIADALDQIADVAGGWQGQNYGRGF